MAYDHSRDKTCLSFHYTATLPRARACIARRLPTRAADRPLAAALYN